MEKQLIVQHESLSIAAHNIVKHEEAASTQLVFLPKLDPGQICNYRQEPWNFIQNACPVHYFTDTTNTIPWSGEKVIVLSTYKGTIKTFQDAKNRLPVLKLEMPLLKIQSTSVFQACVTNSNRPELLEAQCTVFIVIFIQKGSHSLGGHILLFLLN